MFKKQIVLLADIILRNKAYNLTSVLTDWNSKIIIIIINSLKPNAYE